MAALLLVGYLGLGPDDRLEAQGVADTGRVFDSWEDWRRAYDDFVKALEAFAALGDESIDDVDRLVTVLEARDRVLRAARPVEDYIYLRLQLDGTDESARSRQHLLDETDRLWYTRGAPWFDREVSDLGRQKVGAWMADAEALRRYDFFFRRFFDSAEHPYPEGQEELRTLSGIFARQSTRLYNALAIAEGPVVEVRLESGDSVEVSPGSARTLLGELASPADRAAVSRARLEALGRQSQTYAALLEGIVGRQKLVAQARGFDSALSAHLHRDAIPAATIRQVIRTAREGSAPLRRYHLLRSEALQLRRYGLADRSVPLDPGGGEIDFEEARSLIVESSSVFGSEVQDLVRRAFSDGWIDAVERPGKRAHGGATFVAGHPFVLVQYRGSLDNLFQLVHEIGHAVHALIAYQTQPLLYSHPSSLTGETVAGVFEGALVESMVRAAESPEEKVRVLDLSIQNILRLFYRPVMDADFELRIYEGNVAMTGSSLGVLYREVLEEYYGETVSWNGWDAHGWQQIPHLYTAPLYLGRYGISSAAASVLISRLTDPDPSEAAAASRAFLELLRSGGKGYPIELLRLAGVDLEDPTTLGLLVTRMNTLVDRLQVALQGSLSR